MTHDDKSNHKEVDVNIDKLVDRFLAGPLPDSVCVDFCATNQQTGRSGTNLLTADEARQMFEHVLCGMTAPVKDRQQQQVLMRFDPAYGTQVPYPSHAQQWRDYHGKVAWLFNPWTGARRDAQDIGSDTFGLLIIPPGEPVVAG